MAIANDDGFQSGAIFRTVVDDNLSQRFEPEPTRGRQIGEILTVVVPMIAGMVEKIEIVGWHGG